jgi:hypothetical protein
MRETDRSPLIGLQPHWAPILPPSELSPLPEEYSGLEVHPFSFEGSRFPLTHPRLVAARTILFNDGGLHVSRCGRFMAVMLAPKPPPSLMTDLFAGFGPQLLPPPPPLPPDACQATHSRNTVATTGLDSSNPPPRTPRIPILPRYRSVSVSSYSPVVSLPIRFDTHRTPPQPPPSLVESTGTTEDRGESSDRSTRRRIQVDDPPAGDRLVRQAESLQWLFGGSLDDSDSPAPDSPESRGRIVLLSLDKDSFGIVLKQHPFSGVGQGTNVTSVKLSPTLEHVLVTLEPPSE